MKKCSLLLLLVLVASKQPAVKAAYICLGVPIYHDTLCEIAGDDSIVCLVQDHCQFSGFECKGQDCILNFDQATCVAAGCGWVDSSAAASGSFIMLALLLTGTAYIAAY